MKDIIKLEHGSGGKLSRELVDNVIFEYLKNDDYKELNDATAINVNGEILFSTDSYVVDPPFFPDSDIGKLAIFGTCNDLAVSGAKPQYLSLGIILEQGYPMEDFKKILQSIKSASEEAGVKIVTGDTKVVPEGKGSGIFINTSGIGIKETSEPLSVKNIAPGDLVLLSNEIGAHGIAVMSAREGLEVGNSIKSDCAFLYPLCKELFSLNDGLKYMRDATRGGISAVLNEITEGRSFGIEIEEESIKVDKSVKSIADILGLNVKEIANEGTFIAVIKAEHKDKALTLLKKHNTGKHSHIIGKVVDTNPGIVTLKTSIGGKRILDFPRGLLLPRIC